MVSKDQLGLDLKDDHGWPKVVALMMVGAEGRTAFGTIVQVTG